MPSILWVRDPDTGIRNMIETQCRKEPNLIPHDITTLDGFLILQFNEGSACPQKSKQRCNFPAPMKPKDSDWWKVVEVSTPTNQIFPTFYFHGFSAEVSASFSDSFIALCLRR